MHLLVHVEQYDVLGILPSQLESLALLANAMGIDRRAFIDNTTDGVRRAHGFEGYPTLLEWHGEVKPLEVVAFVAEGGEDIRDLKSLDPDSWLVFGPSMGWSPSFETAATIPGGTLNSRDAVPIALWEVSAWRAQ